MRLQNANGHEWRPWHKRHIYAPTVGRDDVWTMKRGVLSNMGVNAGIMVGV
ncbi:hypothetical protein DPMN_089799 [Dreissena polymorpha]|uniref:Uncharacterized protein n=1 Tax=Dreissena polymorpha TaxID=45954 RepID=A0A9D4KWK9_DREPO|nr:hypothetical protein DPMN_089799 [Dreissena polymorpha]